MKSVESYVKHMPMISSGTKLIAKSVGAIWYQDDVVRVLERHKGSEVSKLHKNLKYVFVFS